MSGAPVDLVILDSGPLISLAYADRLDLVEVFDRPIIVPDIVRLECLKKPDAPDHSVLERWFARAANRVRVVDTPVCEAYEAALERFPRFLNRRGFTQARFSDSGSVPG